MLSNISQVFGLSFFPNGDLAVAAADGSCTVWTRAVSRVASKVGIGLAWQIGESKLKGLKRYDIFKYIIDIVDVLLQNRFLHNMDLDVFDKLVVET